MKITINTIRFFLLSTLSSTFVSAEIPNRLKGSWVIDPIATAKNMKASPEWNEYDPQYSLVHMSDSLGVVYKFDDGSITITFRGAESTYPITVAELGKNKYEFKMTVGDATILKTIYFFENDSFNIKFSANNKMDYYIWVRGLPRELSADMALEIEALEKTSPCLSPESSWNTYLSGLENYDMEKAFKCAFPRIKKKYKDIFENLSQKELKRIKNSIINIKPIDPEAVNSSFLEYTVTKESALDGKTITSIVTFMRNGKEYLIYEM